MSRAYLQVLEKRLMDAIRILYMNPSKCFSRKNGKNYTNSEATRMLDGRLEVLGTMFEKQYSLIKGELESDNKKWFQYICLHIFGIHLFNTHKS